MSSGPNSEAAEVRELGDDELATKLQESKEELFNLRFQAVTGQLDNNRRLATVRREIARIYTVMRERELGIAPPAPVITESPSAAKAIDTKSEENPATTTDVLQNDGEQTTQTKASSEADKKEKSEVVA